MDTVCARRPPRCTRRNVISSTSNAPPAVIDGLKIAPKNGVLTTKFYDSTETLLHGLKIALDKNIYVTLYLDSKFECTTPQLRVGLKRLCQSKKFAGMTMLLDCHEMPERVPHMDIPRTAEYCGAQLAVYGSFSRTYGLPGACVAGRKQLISELRYSSREYIFTTCQLPFVMGMIAEALKSGKESSS